MRVALGVAYNGQRYSGWQSQLSGNTIQDHLEAALGRFAAQEVHTSVRAAPMPECTASCRSSTSTRRWTGPRSPGSVAPTPSCRRTSPCNGPSPCPTPSIHGPAPQPGAMPMCCCSRPCGPAWRPGVWAGCSMHSTVTPCRPPPSTCWRARFQLVPRIGLPGQIPVKTLHRLSITRAWQATAPRWPRPAPCVPGCSHGMLLLAIRVRGQRLPPPHGAQHHGLPARRRPGHTRAAVDATGAGGALPRCRRAHLLAGRPVLSGSRIRSFMGPSFAQPGL